MLFLVCGNEISISQEVVLEINFDEVIVGNV